MNAQLTSRSLAAMNQRVFAARLALATLNKDSPPEALRENIRALKAAKEAVRVFCYQAKQCLTPSGKLLRR